MGHCFLGAGLAAAVAVVLAACGAGSLSDTLRSPFSKGEERLPGERVSVITDPGQLSANEVAVRPVSLPPERVNPSWTQPGGAPSNNPGHLALAGGLSRAWSANAGTGSSSSGRLSAVPLVAEGKVFTLDARGNVSAFSSAGGSRIWTADLTPPKENSRAGYGGGLALDGGRLYVTTGFGTVVALDAGNGAVQWTKSIGGPIRTSPTVAGGKVYFVSAANTLHALNAATGDELWKSRGLPSAATLLSNASPAVAGSMVVAPFPAGDIVAFEASSGKRAWTDSLTRSSETSAGGVLGDPARPVVDRDVVFAVSHGGRMVATSLSSGARLWTRNVASTQMPWVAGDAVFVVDTAGRLTALGRSDGQVRWVTELPSSARWSGPVVAGSRVWAVSGEGLLVGADARTGQLGTQIDLKTDVFVTPVVAGGRMYILSDDANLIALN